MGWQSFDHIAGSKFGKIPIEGKVEGEKVFYVSHLVEEEMEKTCVTHLMGGFPSLTQVIPYS